MLSRLVGKSLAHAVWPDQLKTFEQEVSPVITDKWLNSGVLLCQGGLGDLRISGRLCEGRVDCLCQVEKRNGDLLNYIIFLRVTPLLPNIFINIASPVVNVPIFPFALGENLFPHMSSPRQCTC